ncbi:hypothetical protein ACZ87_00533 [Candidatus Erwinia dacicola]|uniref:Uncharacterized protein n=1 Tax=Candidatus Erwinia dacicola TaxID=252393 RepID=A0A328TQV6_9GAMM|nr:hypothetical protein ACZ87_00533 [Candidatus Erwinia dacicola]
MSNCGENDKDVRVSRFLCRQEIKNPVPDTRFPDNRFCVSRKN